MFCKLLTIEDFADQKSDANKTVQNYVDEYGILEEQLKFVDLPLWVSVMLRCRILNNALETAGLSFTDKGTKRQLRIKNEFQGGKKLILSSYTISLP